MAIPTIVEGKANTGPLLQWFDKGDSISPAIYDLVPCKKLKCRRPYAVNVRVNVRRHSVPDGNEDPANVEHLRARVAGILVNAEKQRADVESRFGWREAKLDPASLTIEQFANGTWARVTRRNSEGGAAGVVYWRLLGGEYTIAAGVGIEPDLLPGDLDPDEILSWFPKFVRGIEIKGSPKN